MLLDRREPELGGAVDMLDVVGVDFYWNNRWLRRGSYGQPLSPFDERRRPLRRLLADVNGRYRRPLFLEMEAHHGRRAVHAPLTREVRRQQAEFAALLKGGGEGAAAVA